VLMMKERRPAFRTIEGWAKSVLLDAGAIRECEEHGWMRDRSDPHALERALLVARQDPPPGVSPDEAAAAVEDVHGSIWPRIFRRKLSARPNTGIGQASVRI
jgi:hypothetical protein